MPVAEIAIAQSFAGSGLGSLVLPTLRKFLYCIELVRGKHAGTEELNSNLDGLKALLRDTEGNGGSQTLTIMRRNLTELRYRTEAAVDAASIHLAHAQDPGCRDALQVRPQHWNLLPPARSPTTSRPRRDVEPPDDRARSCGASAAAENRHVADVIADAVLVGTDAPRKALFDLLVPAGEQRPRLDLIAVAGESGVGKTVLTRDVYEDRKVKACFDCHVWVAMDVALTDKQFLTKVVSLLYGETNRNLPRGIDKMEVQQLRLQIHAQLVSRRYIIVLDNLNKRDEELTLFLEHALPKDSYARVIFTTLIPDFQPPSSHNLTTIDLKRLSPEEATLHFCRSTFEAEECPTHLRDLAREIVELCEGLPFVIAVVGGLLSKRERSDEEWGRFLAELRRRGNIGVVTAVLAMSINDLEAKHKNCLLCFGIFPRGCAVTSANLIRVWIAEGFVEAEQGVAEAERPLEDIANGYLEELRQRRVIQQAESYDYGRTKSWKVHDVIHQALVAIAEEENFSTISMRHSVLKYRNIRRLSVQDTMEEFPQSVSFKRLRTLFIFKQISNMPRIFPSKKTLRALNLEGARIDRFPKEIESLIFLRYLNLRNTKISELPNSLKNFKFLQTLDLKGTCLSKLPNEILELNSLRHLLVYHYDTAESPPLINGVKVPKGIGKLKELQTLSVVDADNDGDIVEELKHLSQLRRLGIVKLRAADASKLLVFVPGMRHLSSVSLTLSSVDDQPLSLQDLAASRCLKRLYVRGELQTLPTSFSSLKNLVRLRLRGCQLREDLFRVLEGLQSLAELSLIQAYDGEQLVSKQGGFPKLKILDLDQLDNLINVTVEGAMPGLEKLIIRNCEKLKTVPLGIMRLTNLKELHLFEMPENFLSKLSGGEDCDKVKHVEYICYYKQGVPRKIPSSRHPGIRIREETAISQLPSTDPTRKGKEIAEEPPEEIKLVTAEARNKSSLEIFTEEFLEIVKGSKISYADITVGLSNPMEGPGYATAEHGNN
ncbi:Disease resistance protein RPM1 [Ananas comosus]|uniref:Disease resistance protein RPM1 n=1 Tax=Ananas comosus TaxID=4615 RepID=A0A199VYM2_ANACO|nr:Disease resistance protein RPM1 [Ananas comosus]